MQALHFKLVATARRLRSWSHSIISNARLKFVMALDAIHRLDVAQESRELSEAECHLRSGLKRRVTALAVIERARKRQASRITNLKLGDANTKFFHSKLNARRRKNYIQKLSKDGTWTTSHDDKEKLVQDHFSEVLGAPGPRGGGF